MISIRKTPQSSTRHNENGSVIFYILIAVALIASLSYAISSGMRGSGTGVSEKRIELYATEILEHASILHKAVAQLKLRGCDETEISFENTISTTDYTNTANPTGDYTCHVFHVDGAGVQYRTMQPDALDSSFSSEDFYNELLFTAKTCIPYVGSGDLNCQNDGSDVADLIVAITFLNKEICIEINNTLSIGPKDADPPKDGVHAWGLTNTQFSGTYTGGKRLRDDTNEYLNGKQAGCFEADTNPDGGYHFYKVLLAR